MPRRRGSSLAAYTPLIPEASGIRPPGPLPAKCSARRHITSCHYDGSVTCSRRAPATSASAAPTATSPTPTRAIGALGEPVVGSLGEPVVGLSSSGTSSPPVTVNDAEADAPLVEPIAVTVHGPPRSARSVRADADCSGPEDGAVTGSRSISSTAKVTLSPRHIRRRRPGNRLRPGRCSVRASKPVRMLGYWSLQDYHHRRRRQLRRRESRSASSSRIRPLSDHGSTTLSRRCVIASPEAADFDAAGAPSSRLQQAPSASSAGTTSRTARRPINGSRLRRHRARPIPTCPRLHQRQRRGDQKGKA